jgi:octaprenyl-diphosphate synthase
MNIKEIYEPIKEDLKKFEEEFASILRSNVFLIDTVVRYIINQKGKKLRPVLVLLTSRICGEPNINSLKAAAMVELLHTATLIHDDVVDESDTRRGLPSINSIWKNKISVLMGDYFLAKSLIEVTDMSNFRVLQIVSETAKQMARGELLALQRSKNFDIDEEGYFDLITDKTAALISASCQLGAVTTSDDLKPQEQMKNFGKNVGIAFQIKDDLFDYTGDKNIIGKPTGSDTKDNKITLPLIYSFKNAPKKEIKEIIKLIKNGTNKKEMKQVVEFVKGYSGIDYAQSKAEEYAKRAKEHIKDFPNSPAKEALLKFVDFTVKRDK